MSKELAAACRRTIAPAVKAAMMNSGGNAWLALQHAVDRIKLEILAPYVIAYQ